MTKAILNGLGVHRVAGPNNSFQPFFQFLWDTYETL
jgi:hypothetical protein